MFISYWSAKQVRMYYGLRIDGRCCTCAGQMLRVHSPGGSTFLREMTPWPPLRKCNRLGQSTHIYLK